MNDSTTPINCNDINQLSNLKNNDVVFLKHFEDMANIYIINNPKLFNKVLLLTNNISMLNYYF